MEQMQTQWREDPFAMLVEEMNPTTVVLEEGEISSQLPQISPPLVMPTLTLADLTKVLGLADQHISPAANNASSEGDKQCDTLPNPMTGNETAAELKALLSSFYTTEQIGEDNNDGNNKQQVVIQREPIALLSS